MYYMMEGNGKDFKNLFESLPDESLNIPIRVSQGNMYNIFTNLYTIFFYFLLFTHAKILEFYRIRTLLFFLLFNGRLVLLKKTVIKIHF